MSKYVQFRDSIQKELQRNPAGLTWTELRCRLDLPSERACPEWTKQLEQEIRLTRTKGSGRALVWRVPAVVRSK